jgi:hypothetical protein
MGCPGAPGPVRLLTEPGRLKASGCQRMHRSAALRTVALLVVAILVGPALTECVGWVASAAGRHHCCGNRGAMASETRMTPCCAKPAPSSDATPPDTQTTRPVLTLLGPHFVPASDPFVARTPVPLDAFVPRRAAVVPLYLQQSSLLI